MNQSIPKRVTTALIQSLSSGVAPRVGLEYIAVGRKMEIEALLNDLDNIVAMGGASFRIISGRYGSGKSFLEQLIRNYALQRNYVVADADLSPTRRLTGTQGQGIGLYRELLNNLATRTRPDGNAFAALLERWISDVQTQAVRDNGLSPSDPALTKAVEQRIYATVSKMEELVNGFEFATVINAYWSGYQNSNDARKALALRWLRGEFNTKAEAHEALGVRTIIDDLSWYDYLKLLAQFAKSIGYMGLVIFIDEGASLYKISNTVARNNNYERFLTNLNDTLQGKKRYLCTIFSSTPQMIEDRQRGLFSSEALRTRLQESRFMRDGLQDLSGPIIRLNVLTPEEIFVLLQRIREIHGIHFHYVPDISDEQIKIYMTEALNQLGANQFLTTREVVRDFITLLNILQQNPRETFESLVNRIVSSTSLPVQDPETLTPETEINDDDKSSPYTTLHI